MKDKLLGIIKSELSSGGNNIVLWERLNSNIKYKYVDIKEVPESEKIFTLGLAPKEVRIESSYRTQVNNSLGEVEIRSVDSSKGKMIYLCLGGEKKYLLDIVEGDLEMAHFTWCERAKTLTHMRVLYPDNLSCLGEVKSLEEKINKKIGLSFTK